MWRIPLAYWGGVDDYTVVCTGDEWFGNLWDYFGQPAQPVDVSVTADSCDVGGCYIPADFAGGSTFTFIAINGGRFVGEGGNGGDGGDDLGASATAGGHGTNGGAAISSEGFNVDVDIDDGYMFGGGGGGAGGAGADNGASSEPGGGGGGGQGFSGGSGGTRGSGIGVPLAKDGVDGSNGGPGAGGGGGGTVTIPDGGAGGVWGSAGVRGYHDSRFVRSGIPGRSGNAFAPISGAPTITYTGAKTEATLRSEARILGETDGFVVLHGFVTIDESSMSPFDLEYQFQSTGVLAEFSSISGSVSINGYWFRDTLGGITRSNFPGGATYEILADSGTRNGDPWDSTLPSDDTFYALSSTRDVGYSASGSEFLDGSQMFVIRRAIASGGVSGSTLVMGYYHMELEDGS